MLSKNSNIIYRKASTNDSKEIAKLNFLIMNEDLSKIIPEPGIFSNNKVSIDEEESAINEQINDPDYEIVLATLANKIVGVLVLLQENYTDDLVAAPFSTIETISSHPNYRHFGIGQGLLMEAEKIAISKQHHFIDLQVWDTNINAISLYDKSGFVTIERRMLKKIGKDSHKIITS
jgi:ribosomal protein S18 acetylase RimI-like enzyme